MTSRSSDSTENNTITVNGSTLSGSPVTAGSSAHVSVSASGPPEDQQVSGAINELRQALREAQAATDRRDDETRERLDLAASRLQGLEDEMHSDKPTRDWARVKKLMGGLRDAVSGLTGLTVGVEALWDAITKVVR